MAVKLGSARIDERGKAKGGKAGDQTGKECSTQSWYKHSKGWRVFRAYDPVVAEKIAWDMEKACANSHIGYDQGDRLTLYNAAKAVGFDCSKVTKNVETDCSGLVRVCCAYAGVMLSNFTTSNEASTLLKSKQFKELTGTKYTNSSSYLKRGDILVTKTKGHTVVVLSNGSKADVSTAIQGLIEVTGNSVHVRKGPGKQYASYMIAHKGDKFKYQYIEENGWYLIEKDIQNLWISGRYSHIV